MPICRLLEKLHPVSKPSFETYQLLSFESHHHHLEETRLFPDIEKITGEAGIMERNIEQHHLFLPGLETFGQYAEDCLTKKKTFDAQHFIGIMDAFGPIVSTHLKEEIDTLRGLGKYNVQEIKKAYMALAADAAKASKVNYSPLSFILDMTPID